MPPAGSSELKFGYPEDAAYPSREIAYNAAGMITSIVEALIQHDQLRYTPAFMYVMGSRLTRIVSLTVAAVCTACFPLLLCMSIRCVLQTNRSWRSRNNDCKLA